MNMTTLATAIPELSLSDPLPERDAPFAYEWFKASSGRDTLLKMGNAPHEITESSIESETAIIRDFLVLETEGKQHTWMIRYEDKTIGAAWIELVKNHSVQAPSVHLMIGDPSYRGKGLGRATMNALISYLIDEGATIIYSRHLVNNKIIASLNHSLGFIADGKPYADENGLIWQNIKK